MRITDEAEFLAQVQIGDRFQHQGQTRRLTSVHRNYQGTGETYVPTTATFNLPVPAPGGRGR